MFSNLLPCDARIVLEGWCAWSVESKKVNHDNLTICSITEKLSIKKKQKTCQTSKLTPVTLDNTADKCPTLVS